MTELEQKIREKTASADDYFAYLTAAGDSIREKTVNSGDYFSYLSAVGDSGDKLKYAQACCSFFDYCIQNNDIQSYISYKSNVDLVAPTIGLKTQTSMEKIMCGQGEIDFPMEAIANDFEDKVDILDICEAKYKDDNQKNTFNALDVLEQKKTSTSVKKIINGFRLGLTIFGKILFCLFVVLTIAMLFVSWKYVLIFIPVIVRLFTRDEFKYNKVSIWILSLVASIIVAMDFVRYDKLVLLFFVPVVSLVVSFLKGFRLNKYLMFNIIGFNLVVLISNSPLIFPSLFVSLFLLIQCIANEKWQCNWVIDGTDAASMAGTADSYWNVEAYNRQMRLCILSEDMPYDEKRELIYIPTCFYTKPEIESKGHYIGILMSILLLGVVIISSVYVYKTVVYWPSASTRNQNNTEYHRQSFDSNYVTDEDYPFTAQRVVNESELNSYSKEELCIMRNEIFARHGYIFKRADLKEYFSKKSWYNPQFTDVNAKLSKIEIQNVQIILKVEKQKK